MKKLMVISWKGLIFFVCFITALIIALIIIVNGISQDSVNTSQHGEAKLFFTPDTAPEGSLEEMYQDVFMILILPTIEKAVFDYYGKHYSVDPWSVKIIKIKRPNGYRTFYFEMELEIMPYYGPHNAVGIDHITLSVSAGGNIQVKSFEHIK